MRFVELQQGSLEWLAWRKQGLGASDALTISGALPPWDDPTTPRRLWELKTGRAQDAPSNFAQRRGQRLEPIARQAYEELTGRCVRPCCVEHDLLPWLRASLDGLDDWGEVLVEIKAPRHESHQDALEGRVPGYYVPQLLHQAAVTGVDHIDYVSISEHKRFAEKDRLVIVPFLAEAGVVLELLEKEAAFWCRVLMNCWPAHPAAMAMEPA